MNLTASSHPAIAESRRHGVIAVLRAPSAELAINASEALIRGGIRAIEVTYTTPDTPVVIRRLIDRHGPGLLVGAGTVLSPRQAREAVDAGARFLVSPGTIPAVAEAMIETGAAVMMGALTPTEVMMAVELGADVVKLFPSSLGGPAYLRALRGPFPDVPLMPTGGVTAENMGDWFAAGAFAVGAGGDLTPSSAIAAENWAEIERIAGRFTAARARALAGDDAR
ncbi:bifunctional 4-hydroxy-2-oxoglutarate aldolase/2-dehydro-3-deoxy-phosphogluconate aldolase [Microbacterium sp. E-13]|uniref:bifunctional 4-hydroxy-2-oxoglutarate aldolase/2-dehydro-3-deoxy-phosphogluconate aldolase n=1 Tax=Microbacterium sp. E-13 TaxID=3404048 RepID=UPI003CE68BC8